MDLQFLSDSTFVLLLKKASILAWVLFLAKKFILKPFIYNYIVNAIGTTRSHQKSKKYLDSLIHHTLFSILSGIIMYSLYSCYRLQFFSLHSECEHYFYTLIDFIYVAQLAYYICGAIELLFDDSTSLVLMILHHMVTIVLIIWSYPEFRMYGIFIMAIHDIPDVFLDLFKLAEYSKHERVCKFAYFCLLFTFIGLRIGLLPYEILRKEINIGLEIDDELKIHCLLWILIALHIY